MPPNLKNSTYVGAFVFGGEARQQLRRAEEALELWAAHLNLVQVRLGIARDLIAESRYSVAAVEDALKVLSVVQRANAEAIDTADIALTPPPDAQLDERTEANLVLDPKGTSRQSLR